MLFVSYNLSSSLEFVEVQEDNANNAIAAIARRDFFVFIVK